MEGKSDYKPMKGMDERMHVVGPGDNPIYICKKKEIPLLFNDNFWKIFEIWQYFNLGFGLPGKKTWDEQDPNLMKCLLQLESHYNQHFSQINFIIELLKVR